MGARPMDILIHVIDNEVFTFRQEDPQAIRAILATVQPKNLFNRHQLVVQGLTSTSGFACLSIEWIEFLLEEETGWQLPPAAMDARSVTRETWERNTAGHEEDFREQMQAMRPGQLRVAYIELVMRSGQRLFLEHAGSVAGRIEQRASVQSFLEPGGIYARREGGGHVIINPHNVTRWSMRPGVKNPPQNHWPASLIDQRTPRA